ncbi:uncharacterized protein [Periplaneta americana]|uniref:uncharacterized protein n=1 Tax=Periplaneta americana TaxID=6978 RepID=UPI0037E82696
MEWSNEKSIEFIEDYRNYSCLWRFSDPDYKDRQKRRDAHQFLAEKYGLGTRKAVINKIKSFRSYFHRLHAEAKKKKSGSGRDDVVSEPIWFLYKYLLFILDGEKNWCGRETFNVPKAAQSSQIAEDGISRDDVINETLLQDNSDEEEQQIDESSNRSLNSVASTLQTSRIDDSKRLVVGDSKKTESMKDRKKATQFHSEETKLVEEAVYMLRNITQNIKKRDHLTSFGEYVEGRIRNLKEPRLQAIAQMRVNNVLFEMEMGQDVTVGPFPSRFKSSSNSHRYPEAPAATGLYPSYQTPVTHNLSAQAQLSQSDQHVTRDTSAPGSVYHMDTSSLADSRITSTPGPSSSNLSSESLRSIVNTTNQNDSGKDFTFTYSSDLLETEDH